MKGESQLTNLVRKNPITLIDGGALDGLKEPWNRIEEAVKVIGFEPLLSFDDGAAERTVKKDGISFDSVALSNSTAGKVPFYIAKHADSSSLLSPNLKLLDAFQSASKYEIKERVYVATDTLDSQCSKHKVSKIDFIKLDTQGSELSILKGAEKAIKNFVLGIEVEVNFIERYVGQNYFRDIDSFLAERGFEVFDLQRRYGKRKGGASLGGAKGQLTHGTALYMRSMNAVSRHIETLPKNERLGAIAKYLVILALYGYFDVAMSYLNEMKPFVSDAELHILEDVLIREGRDQAAKSKVTSHKLWKLFSRLAALMKPKSKVGVVGDDSLGNV